MLNIGGYRMQGMDGSDQERLQRRFIVFACMAAVVVLLLAWLQFQHGVARTIGVVAGLPIIVVLLIIAVRFSRAAKRP